MYKINLEMFSNLSCMLSYANDVNKCNDCKEGDCTKDYLGECVYDYQVSAYKFLVIEEDDEVPFIDLSILDEEEFDTDIEELNIDRLDVKLADEEMLKDVIDTVKVCSTCDQYDSPWGCCYNAHPICDRIFNNK